MSHAYKKVPPQAPAPISFVAAVKQYGDNWKLAIPFDLATRLYCECMTRDQADLVNMTLMERGIIPRVSA